MAANTFFLELVPNLQTLSLTIPLAASAVAGVQLPVAIDLRSVSRSIYRNAVDEGKDKRNQHRDNQITYSWLYKHQPGSKKSQRPPAEVAKVPLGIDACARATRIECRCCRTALVQHSPHQAGGVVQLFVKSMPLPSEHWQELVECWLCHEDSGLQVPMHAIQARQSVCLISMSSLLLHQSNIITDALVVQDMATLKADLPPTRMRLDRWQPVCCAVCSAVVGTCPGDLSAIELLKVTVNVYHDKKRLSPRGALVTHLAADMLEAKASQGIIRFIVADMLSQVPVVRIWLLSSDYIVQTNRLVSASSTETTHDPPLFEEITDFIQCTSLRNAVKVLFSPYPLNSGRLLSPPVHYDVMLHPRADIVLRLLELSNETMPYSKRSIVLPPAVADNEAVAEWQLGYLRL